MRPRYEWFAGQSDWRHTDFPFRLLNRRGEWSYLTCPVSINCFVRYAKRRYHI